jgi:hypothetical protein
MPFDREDSELTIAEEPIDVHWNDNVYELTCTVMLNIARGTRIVTAPLELNIEQIPHLEDNYKVKRKPSGQVIAQCSAVSGAK